MLKEGCNVTIRIEPFLYLFGNQHPAQQPLRQIAYPIAYVWQSDAGAKAVMGS
jgi:ADP-ribose pyrophosphatase YjhB (NUDIX family)